MADDWGGFEEVQGSGATDEWAGFEDWSGFEEVGTEQPEDASSSDGTLDRSWADTGKDLGLSMLSGAIAIPKQVSGVADLLAAPARYAYEKITGEEARPLTAALADNGLDFQRAQGILGDMKSDASKQQREHVNVKFKEDGVLGGLGALYDNPIVAVESLSESIPGMLALGGATQVFALKIYQQAASSAAASGMGAEAAAAMGRAAVEQAVPKLGAISATLEGAQSAGDMAATSAAEGQLDMRQAGAAAGAGVSTALLGRWINDLGIKLGLEDVEAIVASRGMRDAAGDIFSGGVKGTIREGAEEVAQSGSEQVWGNVGDGKPLTEGVGQAIAEGGIVGGLLGMGGGALGGTRRRQSDGEPSLEALRRAEQEVLHQQELDRQAQDAADRAIEMGGDSLDAELAKQQVYVNGEASGMVPFEPEIASVVPEAKPDDPIVYNPYQQGMRPLEVDPAMELDNTIPFTRDEAPGLSLMDNADIGKPQAEPENTIEFTSPMDEKVASLEGRMEAYQQEKELASYNELPPTREPLPPVPEDDTAPAIPARQEAEAAEIQALEAQRDAIEKSVPGKEKGNQKHANPEMELQQAIAALGGLNRDEARQQGIDPEHFGLRSGGIARVFTSKGKTFDEMAEALSELGFFDGDKDGYSPNRLLDMLGNSLAGNEVYSPRSENAGARIAAQASMDQIEREIATLRSNYDDDQASPPTGPAYSALDDEEKGLAYTMMEAELAGVDPLTIDMLLDGDEPTAVIIEKLRRNIDNAKGQRQQAQPQGAPESGDQGHQAAPQRTGDQAQGRGEEAAPAEIGTTEEVGNATENVGNATVSPVADNQSVPAVRRGRDEKYDVDVEIRRDGGDYVLTEKDASGEREKRISSGAGGIYLGDSILNQDGEFVPPGQIVQAGSAGPESTPFKPEPSDRQAVIDLVAEIEFQRAQGNMDAVEELEARLQRIASGVESVKSPSADNQAEQQSPEADNAPATDLFGAAPKKEQSLADARREKDIQRNGREDVPADIDGGLFSNQSQQTDLSEQIKADEISTKVDQESPTADNAPDQQSPEGDIDAAAHAAATSPKNDLPEPTEAQIEAGNYKHGHVKVSGLDITIENPQGSTRSGKRPDGSTWSNVLGSHYGYLKRTEGADGEHVDVYVGPNPDSDQVFIVDQSDQKGGFDEHKVMLGYDSQAQAEAAYRENYDKGWELGPVTAMSVDQFKEWLATGDTSKPVAPEENALQKAKRKRDARRVERAAAEKPSDRTAQKPTSSPSNTDDVGGEMIANRRLFSGITLADLEGADNEALAVQMAQKSRVWKRPDYEALVKDGMNPLSAYLLKQVYDGIGNKPGGKGEKYRHDYVKAVNELRDAAEAFAGDKSIEAELIDLLKEAAKLQGANPFSNFKARAEINKRALALSDFIMDRVFPENASGKRWGRDNAEGNARVLSVGGNRFVKHAHFDMDTLGKAAKAIVAEGWPAKQEAWQKRFNVEQRDGKWIVKKKKQYRALATAETEAEAIEQAKSLATVEREEAFKEPKVALNRVVREGPDRRDGRDVSTEELRTTFGFQKINFGNWMKGPAHEAERQEHVNHIYDAMLDMAETLGIPPKAMSLNGMLSIAVGAQGRGGKAAAHFVAGVNEINITRESGAGSLAHEWAHAMDHYFAAQAGLAGKDDPFLSEYADNSYALKGSDIRPEIVSAYKTLLKNMKHVEKIRSPEEMQALREKQLESGREAANRYISRWRESIAKASEGKDGKLLESFDKEAAAILGGTPGEHVKMGKSKDYVRQSVDNMREIFKQAVGHYPSRDTANWLSGSAGTIELAADAAKFAETHKPQITERSEYYKGASGLEKNPQKPYWSTSWEMFARAFELYALDQYGKRADYMTARWKTMTEGPLSEHANKAYPREGEREDINKAFQALFDTIEARETDTGVGLFRSGEVSGTQSADVKKAIAGLRDGWKGGPKITVVQSQSDLPAHVRAEMRRQGLDTIAGYFDRTGQHVYLVADGIKDARDAQVTLLHEAVGHYGIEALFGREGINEFLREVHDARRQDPKIRQAYDYVERAYPGASPLVKAAEVVAYIAEGDPKHNLVRRIVQQIRQLLRRLGFKVAFTNSDIIEALRRAKQNLETGDKQHVGGAGGLFQSAYHGSPHRHNKFSTDYIGTGEGNQAYGWGLYFAQKRDIAEYYRDGLAEKPQYVLGRRLVEQFPGISAPALKEIAANYIVDGKSAERSIRLASYAFAKDREAIAAASPEIEKALQSAAKSSGALYAVEVPENDELLDWDAPISEKYMIELYDKMQQTHMYPFAKAFQDRWYKNQEGGRSQWDGQDFYVELSKEAGGDKAASLYLKSIGIPGLRYFDEQSRNQAPPVPEFTAWAGYFKGANLKTISDRDLADLRDEYQEFVDAEDNRTRNFVIFDDSRIDITNSLFRVSDPVTDGDAGLMSRRKFLKLTAGAITVAAGSGYRSTLPDLKLGKATPISEAVGQNVSSAAEKLLRSGDLPGALREIGKSGPEDLRPLATKLSVLIPSKGTNVVVDDAGTWNAHGFVRSLPGGSAELVLATAGERTGLTHGTVLHEALHMAVMARYSSISRGAPTGNWDMVGMSQPKAREAMDALVKLWREYRQETRGIRENESTSAKESGRTPDEFFVRALTDRAFQLELSAIRYRGRSLMDRFKDWVKFSLFGMKSTGTVPSWLDAALLASNDFIDVMGMDRADFRYMASVSAAIKEQQNSVFDPGGQDDTFTTDAGDIAGIPMQPAGRVSFRRGGPTTFAPPEESIADLVIRKLQDKFKPLKQTQAEIKKAGGTITEESDAYLAEEAFHGKTENDLRKFRERYIEPMAKDMADSDIKREELDLYLVARHADERNRQIAKINPAMPDGGSGMTSAEAVQILARFRAAGKTPALEQAAQYVYDMLQEQRDLKRELQGDDLTDTWEATYKYYVPLKGYAENEDYPRIGRGFDIRGKESMRALGRRSMAESPVLHAIKDTTETFIRRRKNEVGNAFLKLVQDNPSEGYWEVFDENNPDTDRRLVKTAAGEEVRELPVPMHMLKDKYFATKKGGVTYYIKIEDKRLMRAMQNLGPESMNRIVKVLQTITRFLSSMSTSYNPEFTISNMSRDIQTAILNVLAEQDLHDGRAKGKKLATKMVAGVPIAIRAIHASLYNKPLKGKAADWQNVFDQFREDGAKTGWFDMKDIDGLADDLERLVDVAQGGTKGKMLKTIQTIKDVVEHANSAIENGVRLSVYKHALEAGVSRKQAASLAKNLTVNFNRKGEIGAVLNSLYMFANASVQGTATFARSMLTMKELPSGRRTLNTAQKVAAGLVGAAFLLSLLNREMAGEDDDDENWYDKVPGYVRERNVVLMKSLFGGPEGEYYTIPLPYGYNVFYNLGDSAEALVNSDSRGIGELAVGMLGAILGSFSPLGVQSSDNPAIALAKTGTPTVLSPVVQLAFNENFFGAPIYRENAPYAVPEPASHRSFRSTKEHWKNISEFLNKATGGSAYRSGGIDISPDVLEHLFDFTTGSAGAFYSRTADAVKRTITGEEIEPNEVPFMRRLEGRVTPYGDQDKYYERRDEIRQIEKEYKEMSTQEREAYKAEFGGKIKLILPMKATDKKLGKLRKARDRVEAAESLTDAERKARLEEIQDQMEAVVDDFNRRYTRAQ